MNSSHSIPLCWFKRWGWVYRPVHPLGWGVDLAALVFLVQVFVALDAHAHSVSDMFYKFYVYAVPTFLGAMWIASRTSDESGGAR